MPTYSAGEASIKVSPTFKDFVKDAETYLKTVDLSAKVRLDPQLADAEARFTEFADKPRTAGVTVDLDDRNARLGVEELSRARVAEIEARILAKEQAQANLDEVAKARVAQIDARTQGIEAENARLDELARTREAKIQARVDKTTESKASSDLKSMVKDLQEAGTLNLKVLGVVGAAGAVADLLAIGNAAAQASHALGLLPSVGFAGLAGAAAVKVGSAGIAPAFQAYTAASADPVGNALKQRDAANAVADAQYKVGDAQRAVSKADREEVRDQKDLTQAYIDTTRSIRDMNTSLEDEKLNVSDAGIAVREAAANLQKVQYDPSAGADQRQKALNDYQRAVLKLQEAQNKEGDVAQDTAKANAKGVEGSQAVIDAKQKVADGVQAEADAAHNLQDSYQALTKAQTDQANVAGQDKIASALAKLSPSAKQLVQDLHGLGPAWKDMRVSAQDALTAGIGPAVERLADAQLPNLRAGLVGIDAAINSGLKGSLAELSTAGAKSDLKTAFDNTAAGFGNASKAAAPLTDALVKLVSVGSGDLPAMGQAVDHIAIAFNNLIQRTAADGSLKKWIDGGTSSAKELAQVAEHVGSSIASVFKASGDNGATLKSLDDLTAKMAAFLKSGQGQEDLKAFFTQSRDDLKQLAPILKDLPALLKGVSAGFSEWSQIAAPFLKVAADLLAAHPELVRNVIAAYAGFKTIKPIVDGAGLAIDALAKKGGGAAAGSGGLGKLKAASAGVLSVLGNPWTIGLVAAGTELLAFQQYADKSATAVQRFAAQAQQAADDNTNLQKALQTSGGKLDTGVLDAETQSIKNFRDGLAANANDIPGLSDKIQTGVAGIGHFLSGGTLGQGILDNFASRSDIDSSSKAISDALGQIGLSNDQLSRKITGDKPAFDDLITKLSGMGQGGRDAASKLQGLRDEWAIDTSAVTPVTAAIKDLGDKNKNAADSIDAATNAMERQRTGGLTLEAAHQELNQALTTLGTSTQTAGGAMIDASGKIDTTTASGQQLYQLLNGSLQKGWEDVTNATYRNAIQSGETADQAKADAQKASDAARDSASQQIQSMGYTQAQADALLQHYQPLDKNFNATFTADTSQAADALTKFQQQLDKIKETEGSIPFALQPLASGLGLGDQYHPQFPSNTVPPSQVAPWQQYYTTPGRADGGPVYGPGTDTSDSIVMRLSTGEYVIKADAVRKYGLGAMDAINAETISTSAFNPTPTPTAAPLTTSIAPATTGTAPSVTGTPTLSPGVAPVLTDPSTLPQSVTYPQAPLPSPQSDAQLQVTSDRSAVDAANSDRNQVYANPASTAQDKLAADDKYRKAANAYGGALQQLGSGTGGAATLLSAQGAGQALGIGLGAVIGAGIGASIGTGQGQVGNAEFGGAFGSKYGGELGQILGGGVLGFLGLDNSVLSSTNSWNSALQKGVAAAAIGGPGNTLGYLYQPRNLPSIQTPSASLPAATPGQNSISPGVAGTSSVTYPTYNPSGGAEQWRGLAAQMLAKEGFDPTPENVNLMLAQINTESSGNPQAINLTDSNAQAGHPSQGILQTIPSTFAANRDPSLPNDINDPAANMAAALRYYRARYGNNLAAQWGQGHGYADGGLVDGTGGSRSDGVPLWGSPGEFMVNAYATARNRPLLEAINASQWTTPNVSGISGSNTTPGSVVNRDHSVQYHGPTYVMNPSELVRQQDRWVEQQSMGALAAYT